VKFETTVRFDNDFKALPQPHKDLFRALMKDFSAACDAYVAGPGSFGWPRTLRVGRLSSAPGLWEMTWSFTGPDDRATFEFVTVEGEVRVRWRRIGRHGIFTNP
jgi:hypothetical protein